MQLPRRCSTAMHATLTEKYSLPGRIIVLLVAALVLMPAMASAATHPVFNLQSTTQSPFPSDRFTVLDSQQRTGLRVNMPLPNCATNPSDCADLTLLNQLDGFNLQPRLSIPFDGAIDPSTANSNTIFLVQIPAGFTGDGDQPVTPNIIGINQVVWDPASLTLFAESDQHLDQRSSYLLVVTTGVHDAVGNPIAAPKSFLDLNAEDSSDARLRTYRQALRALIDNGTLHRIAPRLDKKDIAAASLFTTESATATLESIREQIKAAAPPTVNFNLGTNGEKTVFPVSSIIGILWGQQTLTVGPLHTVPVPTPALQVFPGSVGTLAFGKFTGQHWQNGNVFIPQVPTTQSVPSQG